MNMKCADVDNTDTTLSLYLEKSIELSQVAKDLHCVVNLYTKKIKESDNLNDAKLWAERLLDHATKI